MAKLPDTHIEEDDDLDETPPDGTMVSFFGEVAKLDLAFPLELLFATDILETVIEFLDPASKVLNMLLLVVLVQPTLANGDVQMHLHLWRREPSSRVVRP
jgi:hypothetical protein